MTKINLTFTVDTETAANPAVEYAVNELGIRLKSIGVPFEYSETDAENALPALPPTERHNRGEELPDFVPGQTFTMYGETWQYLGPNDWLRTVYLDDSDSVDAMDDDEMRGQEFEYRLDPNAKPTVKTVRLTITRTMEDWLIVPVDFEPGVTELTKEQTDYFENYRSDIPDVVTTYVASEA